MSVQPAWWERVWLEPDLLTMHMNCPGIFLLVVMLQAGKTLSVYLPHSSPFLYSPSQEAKSLCLQWRSATAGLGLDGKNTLQQTQCGWGHKSSPSQPSHAAPPPPAATRKVPNSLRAALVPAPRVLLLHFTGDFTIVARCFGH